MHPQADGKPADLSGRMHGNMVLARPLGSSEGVATTALLLNFSIADALAEYDPLRLAVVVAGLVGLAAVAFASMRVARRIVRPIAALERAAKSRSSKASGPASRSSPTTRSARSPAASTRCRKRSSAASIASATWRTTTR